MHFCKTHFTILFILTLLLICSSLYGCSRKTPVESAFNGVQEAISVVKENLPTECKTNDVMAKFNELEAKREIAESVCQAKIKDIQSKYERALWVIFLIIFAFFVKNFIKK